MDRPRPSIMPGRACRGKRLHTRNQHLRSHRAFSVAFANGCSVAFSNGFVTCQRYFPKDCHFPSGCLLEMSNGCSIAFSNGMSLLCDFWCVIFCPEPGAVPELPFLHPRIQRSRRSFARERCGSQERWEVLLRIRILGTTFWCGLSNHQAPTAQMGT